MAVTVCVVLVYSLIEETFGHPIKHALFWPFQAIKVVSGELVVDWAHQTKVIAYRSNWNMTVLLFMVWPALLILSVMMGRRDYFVFLAAVLFSLLATVLQSHHVAAAIASFCGVAAFAIARLNQKAAVLLLGGVWVLSFLLSVPVALQLHKHGFHMDENLPSSARHRIVFWNFTANEIRKRPILGVGIGSTHPLNEQRKATATPVPGTKFVNETGSHPHNIYLQVIYELGAVGGIVLMSFGLSVLWAIRTHCAKAEAPFYLALFAAWTSQSACSFGLAEAWYLFALGLSVSCLFAASAYRSRMDEPTTLSTGIDLRGRDESLNQPSEGSWAQMRN